MPIKYINKSNVGASAGNSVLFNGSNFLNFGSNALFSFGTGNFTVEGWIYLTTMGVINALFSNGETVAGAIALYTLTNNKLSFAEYYGTDVNGTTTLSINTWYHVAVTRSGSTVRLFLNGNIENSNPSDSFNNTTNNLIIGSVWGTRADGRMNGYISNFRVVKGTALYTSNFTPPTAPLTAIANTSILTCQSPTIIDNSTNNFTITNNGAATVSSVVPFSASIAQAPSGIKFRNRSNSGTATATSTMKMRKVYSDPVVLFGTQKAIFGYGYTTVNVSMTNLVSNTGVVATDTTGVGTGRHDLAAAGYGTDKAIFGYGYINNRASMTNLVSNVGVVSTDTTGVGTARSNLAAAGYGTDKAIFGYGFSAAGIVSMTNLVSNTGVVAIDTTGVGTSRYNLAATGYGNDKAIFGYGSTNVNTSLGQVSMTNLVSNTGIVANDTTGVGTARNDVAAASYGTDKAIFGYGFNGSNLSMTNLVSNTGIVANDTTGVGTERTHLAAAGYGSDKAIFGYGSTGTRTAITNLVNNTGVVATDTAGVGTARQYLAAAGYSLI